MSTVQQAPDREHSHVLVLHAGKCLINEDSPNLWLSEVMIMRLGEIMNKRQLLETGAERIRQRKDLGDSIQTNNYQA